MQTEHNPKTSIIKHEAIVIIFTGLTGLCQVLSN